MRSSRPLEPHRARGVAEAGHGGHGPVCDQGEQGSDQIGLLWQRSTGTPKPSSKRTISWHSRWVKQPRLDIHWELPRAPLHLAPSPEKSEDQTDLLGRSQSEIKSKPESSPKNIATQRRSKTGLWRCQLARHEDTRRKENVQKGGGQA